MRDPLALLMERNLLEVFGQRDPELRKAVIGVGSTNLTA
jgi:hypothetical protein